MDYHSKNVYLIGVLYTVNCLLFLLSVVIKCIKFLTIDENDAYDDIRYGYHSYERINLPNQLIYGGISVFLASLAAVMVRGVVKKSHKLIAPFLVINVLICGSITLYTLQAMTSLYNSTDFLYSIGLTALAVAVPTAFLYPTYTLFEKFRSEMASKARMEISTVDCQEKNDAIKK